mgnify:CR=1 FL=1
MTFVKIEGYEYTKILTERLEGKVPERTFLKQFRKILKPHLKQGTGLLDVGCATGYAYNSFKEFIENEAECWAEIQLDNEYSLTTVAPYREPDFIIEINNSTWESKTIERGDFMENLEDAAAEKYNERKAKR